MKRIVLISCVWKKQSAKSKAKDLYISPLFKTSLAYAYSLNPDEIFVLSALHHLLDLEAEIEPYNVTLSNIPKSKKKDGLIVLSSAEKIEWGKKVVTMLSERTDLQRDHFIILAGREYIKPILPYLLNIDDRLRGMSIGKRLSYLKSQIKCSQ